MQAGLLQHKTLVIAHEIPYLSLDPQLKNDNVTWSVIGNIFEPLVEFDSQMKLVGSLAERWENPNDLTWRFYLRRNVRFHDGKPFNAEDVAYTIRRGLAGTNAGTRPYLISVKDVNVIDPLTVDIITDRPNPVLLNRLTFIFILPVSAHPEEAIHRPMGTGPYMFEREDIPGQKLTLRANPAYWGGQPAIEHVQFVSLSPAEKMVEGLLKGSVQLIRDFPETLIPRIEKSANCTLKTHDSLGVSFLGFNLTGNPKTNPFQRLEVRKAIAAGLDSARLVAEGMEGRAVSARQLVSPVVFGYNPELIPEPVSLDRARQMLKKAGLPQGFHSEVYGVDAPRLIKLAGQLRELGLDVEPHLSQWSDLYEKLLHHQVPMYALSWNCSTGDASDLLDSCLHTPDPNRGYGNFNYAGYGNREVDHLIELSGQTLKPNERKVYLQKALVLASKDVPYIPLYSRFRHYGVSKDLNWEPRRDGRLYASDMSWKQQQ
ncbi:MAG TPA: ABC transporter substrate-binding protein [Acidobacteriota bacterium]|nr:ABC transporter substrate-binding protein [Acidobacteriota bacterium]